MNWVGIAKNILPFLLNQKLVHVMVIIITVLIVFTNVAARTKAGDLNESGHKTILSSLVENDFGSIEEEQLIEEFFDEEAVISPTQQTYLDNLTSIKNQPQALMQIPDNMEEKENVTSIGGTAIVKPDIISTKKTEQPRKEIVYYTVKPGDTVSTMAQIFAVSVNTILWENNLSAYSIIRPGDRLAILPMSGVTHKVKSGENIGSIAKEYKVDEEKIIIANKLADAYRLQIGQKVIIPGGRNQTYTPYTPKTYSGLSAIKNLVKPSSATPMASNKMNWPTVGYRITQYYSWRHRAIDIADKMGTPVYAADAGTIEYLGWGKGYGNQIVINHGGGKKTRYAHLSKFYVKKGQIVSKGEAIGGMGSTGWSTGSHVHFEIIINNKKYNPLNYIK